MPATEYGPEFFREFADLQRRVKVLELTERVGLNRITGVVETSIITPSAPTTWEVLVSPSITLITGERALIALSALTTPAGGSNSMGLHYVVNGSPLVSESGFFRTLTSTGPLTLSGVFYNDSLVRGTNVFKFRIFGSSTSDQFTNLQMIVIPIDAG